MIDAKQCTDSLLDTKRSVEEKALMLAEYLDWHSTVASRMGVGVRFGRELAVGDLFKQLPHDDADALARLKAALDLVQGHYRRQRDLIRVHAAAAGQQLKSLAPGTQIMIKDPRFHEPVAFVAMKRTRFIIEDTDGCRYVVPVRALARALKDKHVQLMPDEERERREVVRALAGRDFSVARERIVADGSAMLRPLLAEMEAARRRIENAPIGISRGVFAATLGPGRIVSPLDEALLKRIPRVVGELAKTIGVDRVQKTLRECGNHETVQAVQAELDRIGRATTTVRTRKKSGHCEERKPPVA